jgi:hypothetical protein
LLSIVVVALLGGCGAGSDGASGNGSDRSRQQAAREALARFDRAVLTSGRQSFVPLGDLTGQVGAWEAADGVKKRALQSGRILSAGPLPAAPRASGTVVWAPGVTQKVPLISAGDALGQIAATASGDCPKCAPLEVASARLGSARVRTARGTATAPAWIYSLRGTSVRVTRVAVARLATVTFVGPPQPVEPAGDLAVESATTTALSSRSLTATFVGSPEPASKPCGVDYTAEAVESANAVDVVVIAHGHRGGTVACAAVGALRTVEVALSRPLADRVVLDGAQGRPVAVTIED